MTRSSDEADAGAFSQEKKGRLALARQEEPPDRFAGAVPLDGASSVTWQGREKGRPPSRAVTRRRRPSGIRTRTCDATPPNLHLALSVVVHPDLRHSASPRTKQVRKCAANRNEIGARKRSLKGTSRRACESLCLLLLPNRDKLGNKRFATESHFVSDQYTDDWLPFRITLL
ncbi:hypothetical protein HPB51_012919 [Rhipicephalus microplus]|uniref:Uncharacterized protein n=1 Tax=Rhipicephalus microplus TaxID=6941 RepID=A0A9J6F3G5_RHIMP|nr:hypothetical protein HPB51_012919 [Rhipicephalus microplus]